MEKLQSAESAGVTAQSVEFVALPGEAVRVQAVLPSRVREAFKFVEGFSGCLVMISDQEARLVTVVIFWKGSDRGRLCQENARWVRKLIEPFADRIVRAQTMLARLALPGDPAEAEMDLDEDADSSQDAPAPMQDVQERRSGD